MPRPPGLPKTGGRLKGTPNKRTQEVIAVAKESGEMPLDYMLSVMRDPKADAHRRDDMAKSAAPYLHAKVVADGGHMNIRGLNGGEPGRLRAEIYGIRVEFVQPTHPNE